MQISPETIAAIVIVVVLTLWIISKLSPQDEPEENSFQCSRCGAFSMHTERTKEAWRNKKTKFFCQACHAKWLKSRPPKEHHQEPARPSTSGEPGSGAGCLGVVVFFGLIPFAAYFLVRTPA